MKWILAFIFQLSGAVAAAQQGFTFVRFSPDDNNGLSSQVVYSIYQDAQGFMWVGTANGLQRFDGTFFRNIQSRKGAAMLPYSPVYQIIPYSQNVLALNYGDRIGFFNRTDLSYREVLLNRQQKQSVTGLQLWRSAAGKLFVNLQGYGLMQYEEQSNSLQKNDEFIFPGGYDAHINSIFETGNQVWFSGDDGLCVYDRSSKVLSSKLNNSANHALLADHRFTANVSKLYIDRKKRYWLFTGNNGKQLRYCVNAEGQTLAKDTIGLNRGDLPVQNYRGVFESASSGFWIYGQYSLLNWDKYMQRFHFNVSAGMQRVNSIEYDVVNDITEDRDHNIWIATDKGLYFTSFGSGTFSMVNYMLDASYGRYDIKDMLQMPNDDFWFASPGLGVVCVDRHLGQAPLPFYSTPVPAAWPAAAKAAVKQTYSICRRGSEVWTGCEQGVLVVYDTARRATQYLQPKELSGKTVSAIYKDAANNLWMGNAGGDLVLWDGNSFTRLNQLGSAVKKIMADEKGQVWVSVQANTVYVLNPANGKVQTHFEIAEANDMEQLNDSIIAVAGTGIAFINKNTAAVSYLKYENGLPSNKVYRLRKDKDGFLWIITANGLCRYDMQKRKITTYGRKDGVNLATKTNATDIVSGNGLIIFAGQNAVIMFKPYILSSTVPPPNVVITDFRLFNEALPVDSLLQLNRVKLAPDENSFTVYFSSLSYQQQSRITYFYKMEGIDKDWQVAAGNNFQNYPLLPPGDYTFNVYAENAEGIRTKDITSVRIHIAAPFWKQPWFFALLLVLVAGILYLLYRIRINRFIMIEKMRSRVARDLHDDMGSTLSTINILSSMAKSKMNNDNIKAAEYLGKISENSQQMMEAMDDIVWSIKPDNDSMLKLVARTRSVATDLMEAKDIDLHFEVSPEVQELKLDMEQRRDCFLLVKEALNNVAKYSAAQNVWISFITDKKTLDITIRDDGRGFDVKTADSGNGLGNMQKRADQLKASLRIDTTAGKGTTITVQIPLH